MRRSGVRYPILLASSVALLACGGSGEAGSVDAKGDVTAADIVPDQTDTAGVGDAATGLDVSDVPVDDDAPAVLDGEDSHGNDDTPAPQDMAADTGGEVGPYCVDNSSVSWPAEVGPIDATRPVRFVIEAVDFIHDRVMLRNVTDAAIALESGWRIFVHVNGLDLPTGFPIPAGHSVTVHLRADGTDDPDNIYLSSGTSWSELEGLDDTGTGNEVSLFSPPDGLDGYFKPEYIEAFVRWGSDIPGHATASYTLADEATAAGIWPEWSPGVPFVFLFATDTGVIATGDVSDPGTGWSAAPAGCFD